MKSKKNYVMYKGKKYKVDNETKVGSGSPFVRLVNFEWADPNEITPFKDPKELLYEHGYKVTNDDGETVTFTSRTNKWAIIKVNKLMRVMYYVSFGIDSKTLRLIADYLEYEDEFDEE